MPIEEENPLQIEHGEQYTGEEVVKIPGNRVRFVTADGKQVFEIVANPDGHSISVRAIDTFKVGAQLYQPRISVVPECSNSIKVAVTPYGS